MIVVYHNNESIKKAVGIDNGTLISYIHTGGIAHGLFKLAAEFPDSKIVWCHELLEGELNIGEINTLFHHNKLMLSYRKNHSLFCGDRIGYVEQSPFIKINNDVCYPSWQMSSDVGVIHASVLNELAGKIPLDSNFDYFLNSVAKVCMPLGLFCYSEPQLLLKGNAVLTTRKAGVFMLFRFVKQHYRLRWTILLFLNLMIYEKRFPLFPILYCLFFRNRKKLRISLESIQVASSRKVIDKKTIDVIIPTIGRKKYLYDVLQDLTKQTLLPQNVIIVEQNPDEASVSELDFLHTETWPFRIKHSFIHQAGACNARNIALGQVESEWVFLADDDIRLSENFIGDVFDVIKDTGSKAVSVSCVQKKEEPIKDIVFQWGSFGSGCSFVKKDIIENCKFNLGYEFGYGEDMDFGIQIRNIGVDILYIPRPQIIHHKAPMGGFRTKPVLQWKNDEIQSKPSPTVMFFYLLHQTKQQLLGYKTTLFFKYYLKQSVKNPFIYLNLYRKRWNRSFFWAEQLMKQS